jgi:hypothetical protein
MSISNFEELKNSLNKIYSEIEDIKAFTAKMEQVSGIFYSGNNSLTTKTLSQEKIIVSGSNHGTVEWQKNIERLIKQSPKNVIQIYNCFESEGLLDSRTKEKQLFMIRYTLHRLAGKKKIEKTEKGNGKPYRWIG